MKMYTLVTVLTLATGIGIASANAPGRGDGRGPARNPDRGTPSPPSPERAAARAARGDRGTDARGPEARAARAGREGRGDRGGGNLTPEQRIDKREQNQEKRIEVGVKRGQLTNDELARLRTLEDNIQAMETEFKSDGTLSKPEARKLAKALNEASLQIWAERHDTEGNQKPVVRLGKNVFALDELTAKIESGDMTKADARKFLGDFRTMVNLKRRLSSDNLSNEQRARLQSQYNDLLTRYFSVK